MSIPEKTRLDIRQWFEAQMGNTELADAVMEAMPPIEYSDLATKEEVRVLGIELRSEMTELRSELRSEMADLRVDLAAFDRRATNNLRIMVGTQVASMFVLLNFLA